MEFHQRKRYIFACFIHSQLSRFSMRFWDFVVVDYCTRPLRYILVLATRFWKAQNADVDTERTFR